MHDTHNAKEAVRQALLATVCSNTVDEADIRARFAPGYVQIVDGKTLDRDGLIRHMQVQKQHIQDARINFAALCAEQRTVFTHHVVTARKHDGQTVQVQVLAQFTLNEAGQILRCEELTRLVQGSAADRDIGSRS